MGFTGEIFDMDLEPLKDGRITFLLEPPYEYKTSVTITYRITSGNSGVQKFEMFRDFGQEGKYMKIRTLPVD